MLSTKDTKYIRKVYDHGYYYANLKSYTAYCIRKAISDQIGFLELEREAFKQSDYPHLNIRYSVIVTPHTSVDIDVRVDFNHAKNILDLTYVNLLGGHECYTNDDSEIVILTDKPIDVSEIKNRCRSYAYHTIKEHQSQPKGDASLPLNP